MLRRRIGQFSQKHCLRMDPRKRISILRQSIQASGWDEAHMLGN